MDETDAGEDHRKNDRRLKNLKAPWKKGQSGNPKGRRKGSADLWTKIVKKLRERTDSGKTVADLLVGALIKKGLSGDVRVLIELLNRDSLASAEQGPLTDTSRKVIIELVKPDEVKPE